MTGFNRLPTHRRGAHLAICCSWTTLSSKGLIIYLSNIETWYHRWQMKLINTECELGSNSLSILLNSVALLLRNLRSQSDNFHRT